MRNREFPPPPLIAPMPWKAGPERAPLMMTTARLADGTAVTTGPFGSPAAGAAGPASGAAATTPPDAPASAAVTATLATTLAVPLHAATFTIRRVREAAVRERCRPVLGHGPA